jgi:hypothetical protein
MLLSGSHLNQNALVSVANFGKDHWSTLAYIETACVDHDGKISEEKMRCNPQTHREYCLGRRAHWNDQLGTRLNDSSVLPKHDDWDCLIDLSEAGYIETYDAFTSSVKLTDKGWTVAHQLRRYLAIYHSSKGFEPKE